MKKLLGIRAFLNITMAVLVIGGLVYALGFGICLYLTRTEIDKEVDQKVERDMMYVQSYVDLQLQRVEDVAYTLLSSKFGGSRRDKDGKGFVAIDPKRFSLPTEEEVFLILEDFLNINPYICGVAIGFEPFLYPDTKGEYGFAAYVTTVGGEKERLNLGELHDFRQKPWYVNAATNNSDTWSRPFRETSHGRVVTCFSVPLHGIGGRKVGVLALDIDTEMFRQKCKEIAPYPGAEVTMTDDEFRFIFHPDSTYLLRTVAEVGSYADYEADDSMRIKMEAHQSGNYTVNKGTEHEALFYFSPIPRTNWTISIECPKKEVYGNVDRMKRDTMFIAIISLLIMLVCFIWLFRKLQSMTINEASIGRELQVASAIQMGMVPIFNPAFPDRPELDISGFLKPAKSVGGDLYDYVVRNNYLYFCIGDVSGKGIPASLFMMVNLALFRSATQHTTNPAELVRNLNESLSKGNTHCMFCTMFVGILNLDTGQLDYCNAGHNPPIFRSVDEDGNINLHYLKPKANVAVGMVEDFDFEKETLMLHPSESLFLYTDGVTESENRLHELFGEEATLKALTEARQHMAQTSKDVIDFVVEKVEEHANGAEQSDDITMLIVGYKGLMRQHGQQNKKNDNA